MTGVVLVGDVPSSGILEANTALRFDPPPGVDAPTAFIDLMAAEVGRAGAAVVLLPAWRAAETARLVRLARGALDTDRIAGVSLNLPPLALSVVADQLAFVSPYVRPGQLASMADGLARAVYTGAWVNSVANLAHIRTGFGKHVASYLPRGGFSVAAWPHEHVHRITSGRPVQEITGRPFDPVLLLVGGGEGDTEWVHRHLRPALGAIRTTPVAAQPLATEFWGTRKCVEYVALSGHPQALQSILRATVCRPCGWCGEPTALAECPFCHMAQPGAVDVRPPPQPTPPAPTPPDPAPPPGPVNGHVRRAGPDDSRANLDLDLDPPTRPDLPAAARHGPPPVREPERRDEPVPVPAPVPDAPPPPTATTTNPAPAHDPDEDEFDGGPGRAGTVVFRSPPKR
ncbi:hypothetical protein [Actinomadura rayongensis]|uniref:Uncharacterized protein n=1 Tax=Actinomadura rayongensis TaxID=1429076 RepID=A0A6I4W0I8_9ACTN|nr:hypothetical protein [Actinomadura rayongensis]MXQ62941.1 hypothetical protein [Actinomadura rayongensis]